MNLRLIKIIGFVFFSCIGIAQAQEITAIDFNGDLIGKVIPDGKVVSFENQLIGNITADSLIVDFKGKLIGGVIPRGIAIGNDNRMLGKVSNDGTVRLSTGKIVGKVLPNGLVVNEKFDILGAVLFPGLVYSDEGQTVGRLTGDGTYANLQGQVIGFISPDGFAYRRNGDDLTLDGRLISSKMVIGLNGKFIGSVSPGGKVTDFEGKQIGFIKANGFVYNTDDKIIGSIVHSGYAFDITGKYMGLVTYNGEVVNKEKVVGYLQMDKSISDTNGNIIGFMIDIAATISDGSGKYLGRIMPEGNIARGRDIIGKIGPWNIAYNNEGKQIGSIIVTGPIFNYKGALSGHALKNGQTILANGSPLGYTRDNFAFSNSGKVIGATLPHKILIDAQNQILGVNGIKSTLSISDNVHTVSPFGYVYNAEGTIDGHAINLSPVYNLGGTLIGHISPNGQIINQGAVQSGRITQYGLNLDEKNQLQGGTINAKYTTNNQGLNIGIMADGNQILNQSLKPIAQILPDNDVVAYKTNGDTYLPTLGIGHSGQIALAYNGTLLGHVDNLGQVKDASSSIVGKVNAEGIVLDNTGLAIGEITDFYPVISSDCDFLGVVTPSGDVKNYREVTIGKILPNGQVLSESDNIAGYAVASNPVTDMGGKVIGLLSSNGKVINYNNENLGCIDINGQLRNKQNTMIGHVAKTNSVIDFQGKIIGRSLLNGTIVDNNNKTTGYILADNSANSIDGSPIGNLFQYRYAFDFDNKIIGTVTSQAEVINSKGENIAKVDFEGNVISDNQKIGYALYDLYMYDNDNKTVGYIASNGNIMSFNNQKIGKMIRGFGVNSFNKLITRGNRDFYIRDDEDNIVGYLNLDGNLVDNNDQKIGTLAKGGQINAADGTVIATAKPLQYYEAKARKPVYDTKGNIIGYADEDNTVNDNNGNTIGSVSENGEVKDSEGKVIGNTQLDWYRGPVQTDTSTLPEVGSLKINEKDVRRSVNIALTPDGEYLGDILEDGTVINKEGDILGKVLPDGLVVDEEGSLIGIEETAKKTEKGEIFVPANSFGPGGAYGTGNDPVDLGPGGGYGPGERYNPQRAAALSVAQGGRRQNMEVGKISTTYSKEAFEGKQKDWGLPKTLSSWPVDMDMMILADKPIPAVIARSIDTEHEVPVTAFVERNVYAEDGRNIVIPAGSRLIGSCGGGGGTEEASTSARITINWERLIMPNGVMFDMSSAKSADAQGRGGVLGYLDRQLFKKYSLPFVTNLATSGLAILFATDEEKEGEGESSRQQAMNDARENFLENTQNMFNQILEDRSNIRAITFIPAGTRIIVYPGQDLWLRTIDDDKEEVNNKSDSGVPTTLAADPVIEKSTSNSQVVYNENQSNAQPASSAQANNVNAPTAPRNNVGATPPPPPPSTYITAPNRRTAKTDDDDDVETNDVPQLF